MNLQDHPYRPADDAARLRSFRCSTGADFENEVEEWLATQAHAWLYDQPRATFQRRNLHMVNNDDGQLVAVFAWQDIELLAVEGIWLEVLAVSLGYQHLGIGRKVLALAVSHIRSVERDGDTLAAMVHADNRRSHEMLLASGWSHVTTSQGYDVMLCRLT